MTTLSPLPLPLPRTTRSRSRARTLTRDTRQPLSTLPITLFIPPANTLPSPISLSTKRGPSTSTEEIGGSARKVSRTEKEKERNTPTPRKAIVLSSDELGTGKSPARRLFTAPANDEGKRISGVSGAIATPPSASASSSRSSQNGTVHDQHVGSSSQPGSPACNTPSYERGAFGLDGIEYDINVSIHDPGFIVHADANQSTSSSGLRTPRSRRAGREALLTFSISLPSSPSSPATSLPELENQENIPPAAQTDSPGKRSHSALSTPTKHTESDISSYLSVSGSTYSRSTSASGSGTRRRERSKLVNEVFVLRGEPARIERDTEKVELDGTANANEDEEELTPGRKILGHKDKGKAREKLAQEVDAF